MVHGYYTREIKREKGFSSPTCPNCNSKNSIAIVVLCKVHHLIFVPLYPSEKRVMLQCTSCNTEFKVSTFPAFEKRANEVLHASKFKWYHFIGTGLFILFGSFFGLLIWQGSKETARRNAQALQDVSRNDIIFFKTSDKKNTSMKVSRVAADTVFVYENVLSTNKSARDIDEDKNYDYNETYFLRSQLEEMLKNKSITDIDN